MKIALCTHVYYPAVFESLAPFLQRGAAHADLFLTSRQEVRSEVAAIARLHNLPVRAHDVFENRGMDVLPFISSVARHELYRYDLAIKLHTKNPSLQGAAQLELMAGAVLGADELVADLVAAFASDPELLMAGPDAMYRSAEAFIYGNRQNVAWLQRLLHGHTSSLINGFFAGTVFWIRAKYLQGLANVLPYLMEEDRRQAIEYRTGSDGTIAHAIERIWGGLAPSSARVALVNRQLSDALPKYWFRVANASDAQAEAGRRIPPNIISRRLPLHRRDFQVLSQSAVFDADFYRKQYGGSIPDERSALQHFVEVGELLGFSPSERFNTKYYRLAHADLHEHLNSAVHYCLRGRKEGRVCDPSNRDWTRLAQRLGLLDFGWYESTFQDVPAGGAQAHYARFGSFLGRPCSTSFDPRRIPRLKRASTTPSLRRSPMGMDAADRTDVVAFLADHYYDERSEYRLLVRLIEDEDLAGAEALSDKIEREYGPTDVLVAVRAFCLVRRGAWGRAESLMRQYWARRRSGRSCTRHLKSAVPERPPVDMVGAAPARVLPRVSKGRICVYTAAFGDRSVVPPNLTKGNGVDFLCFTDQEAPLSGWTLRKAEPRFADPNLAAKHYKVLPHIHLPDYEYSLFVDANTLVCGRLNEWLDSYLLDHPFVMWPHPVRSDLYRELIAIVEADRHRPEELFAQMREYASQGLPPRSGMVEASCIWRAHHAPWIVELMQEWWTEIQRYSKRDQLSLGYLLWKHEIRPSAPPGALGNSRQNIYFRKLPHKHPPFVKRMRDKSPITFLYAERFKGAGSTVMRGAQLSTFVRDSLKDRDVTYESGAEYRGRILFLTKGYLATVSPPALEQLKKWGNVLLADFVDAMPRPQILPHIDMLVASSIQGLGHYRTTYPDKLSVHLTHHVDPRLPTTNHASGVQLGYIGETVNAVWTPAIEELVARVHVDTSRAGDRWIDQVGRFNVHYAVRRVRGMDGYKPFLKGFTAARCNANIVIQRGSGDVDYYLGHHYPYVLPNNPDEHSILEMLQYVRGTLGGPVWQRALEVMLEVRERSSVEYVMREFRSLLKWI